MSPNAEPLLMFLFRVSAAILRVLTFLWVKRENEGERVNGGYHPCAAVAFRPPPSTSHLRR